MQLVTRSGCVGQLRRTVVKTSLESSAKGLKLATHDAGCLQSSLTSVRSPLTRSRIVSHAPAQAASSDTFGKGQLCSFSTTDPIKPPTKIRTQAASGDDIRNLKQELDDSSTKEETISDSKKIFCEFILQAFFNFLSVTAVAMAVTNSGGNAVIQTLQVMAAHAVILPLTIYSGMETSGAHFNPVITAVFVMVGKMSAKLGLGYLVAQLAGGVLGAAAAFSSLPKSMQTLSHAGLQSVPPGSTIQQAFVGEVCAAFALVFVLFATNIDPRSQWGKLKPLAIPLVVTLLMWLLGPVSSVCINPARAFGPAVVTGFWDHHWIWWTAPFVGGLAAGKIYHSVFLPAKFR